MDRIRPWLYIGNYRDTDNAHLLAAHNIRAILQLASLVEHPGIKTLYVPVEDGVYLPHDLLRRGVDFIIAQKDQDRPILVACGAGISRSAAFCTAALKEVEGYSLDEALDIVQQKHAIALPHPELWAALCDYYDEEFFNPYLSKDRL